MILPGKPIPKRILLLGASFTTRNLGVWALASGAVTSAFHEFPDAEVAFLDYHTESASYLINHSRGTSIVPLVNIRFSKKFWLSNNVARLLLVALMIRMAPLRVLRNWFISRNVCLRHVHEADIVGSIAGGDSFSDIYGLVRLIYVASPQTLALLMGKSLVLLPQTVGPFNSSISKTIARYILRRAKLIYSRDREGLETVQDILGGNSERLKFCHDLGFVLESRIDDKRIPPFMRGLDRVVPVVGLNVSGLLYMGGYTGNNMFGLKADYRRMIQDLIAYFIKKHNAHLILIPHVFGTGENAESDVIACRKACEDSDQGFRNRIYVLEEEYDQHELKSLIGRCDFFLGSRMHACIAAISQCVPAVGLAYSRKFFGVFESVGMDKLVIDLREHDEKSVVEAVERAFQSRSELRNRLEATIPAVKSSVLKLFGQIAMDPV
jgi:polysaccharide pyruvyl transferase WcaK-like protein